jgi:hypothetical protein
VLLGLIFSLVYMQAVLHPTETNYIVRVFPEHGGDTAIGDSADGKKRKIVKATAWWSAFCSASHFSLLSAVNIGFQQFAPGDWIRRLQPLDYSLEAVGWVRVVAGAQALLSVFLLAMWVLTQFGRI